MAITQAAHKIHEGSALPAVIDAMQRIAPLDLADSSWDNVGLLLESPIPRKTRGVFLAVDLTEAVADEMLSNPEISAAVVYHPIIFRGLKSLTLSDPQQRTLLRCAAGGISIYCPHTSLDATPGGINDWLSACISSSEAPKFSSPGALSGSWSPITPTKDGRYPGAGMGRLVRLPQSCSFNDLVDRVKRNLKLPTVQVAIPRDLELAPISTVALCAGSGSSILSGAHADVWLTGELSHHEILAANARGIFVILTCHSNSERKYLSDVLQHRLATELGSEYSIFVSKEDRDPLQTA